jgi:DUF177 domain-containing protein
MTRSGGTFFMSGFLLDLATLGPGATLLDVEGLPQDLDLPESTWRGPIHGRLRVERSGERVTLQGTVSATARLECVRCAEPFEVTIDAPLDVFADRSGTGRHPEDEEHLERDHYMTFHDGRQLDLSEHAREALLLEIPITPRCREDCRGLCPRCGANLNEGPCGHEGAAA